MFLRADNLIKKYKKRTVVNNVSVQVAQGEIVGLLGPNGAGKTTFFNCLTGFYKPTRGCVKLTHPHHGELRLDAMRNVDVARVGQVVRTFQNIRLFPRMTVLENLMIAQHNVLQEASRFSIAGMFSSKSYRRANDKAIENALTWLERLSVRELANKPAGDMPYGVQRRVEIARAMSARPILLCLDEPAAGLNPRESAELTALLTALSREQAIGILLIEHDMSVVMKVSDHIVVLNHGKKIAEGPPSHIKANPDVISAYLGEDDETSSHDEASREKSAHA